MLASYWPWLMAGSVLWTATFTLAVFATIADSQVLMLWSILVGLVSCVVAGGVAGALAVDRGRLQVEEIADLLSVAARDCDLPRARR